MFESSKIFNIKHLPFYDNLNPKYRMKIKALISENSSFKNKFIIRLIGGTFNIIREKEPTESSDYMHYP